MAIINGKFVPDGMAGFGPNPNANTNFGSPNPNAATNYQQMQNSVLPQQAPKVVQAQGFPTPFSQNSNPGQMAQNTMMRAQPQYQNAQTMQNNNPSARQAPTLAQQLGNNSPMMQQPSPNYGYGMQNQQPMMNQYNQMPQQPSVEQSVQSNNPQSVQNFLTALNQAGAGSNNTFMNQPGQQGQVAQGGFQGFGMNGGPIQDRYQNIYSGPMQSQLGYQQNQAFQGQYGPGGYNIQQGGTGGIPGQPQFNIQGPQGPSQQTLDQIHQAEQIENQIMQYNPDFLKGSPLGGGALGLGGYSPVHYQFQAQSDVSSKKDITPAKDELENFLDSLGVYSYEYKNKEYGEGRRISPMAQEIESTPLGQDAISINKDGYKQVNYGKLLGTMLSAQAMLNNKLKDLDEKMKSNIVKNISEKKRGK